MFTSIKQLCAVLLCLFVLIPPAFAQCGGFYAEVWQISDDCLRFNASEVCGTGGAYSEVCSTTGTVCDTPNGFTITFEGGVNCQPYG